MTPEEFRARAHQIVDWIADYRAGVEARPVMARTAPGEVKAQLPATPPEQPEPFDAMLADLDAIVMPGLSHWHASAVLRLLPVQRRALERARRFRQHRTRRARPRVAIEPRADRGRGSRDRLAAPDARPRRRVERRDSGHRVDEHARRARLRARAHDALQPRARRPAGRSRAARRLRVGAQPQLGARRPRCSPASAASTCAAVAHDDTFRDARRRARRARSTPTSRRGPRPCAVVATTGTTTTTAVDPIAAIARRSRRGIKSGCTSTQRWPVPR